MDDPPLKHQLDYLIGCLLDERAAHEGSSLERPADVTKDGGRSLHGSRFDPLPPGAPLDESWALFRALVNVREPWPADERFLAAQDQVLHELIARKGITSADGLAPVPSDPRLRLWRGDITTLEADAIVNAANSRLLGCWIPGHHCIDNAIHTYAGVQLRLACNDIMRAQGFDEPTGSAKVTEAFNLPSRLVVHTVGPIANGRPTERQRAQLASCYASCLDAAHERGAKSIAFCCISTGVFGFPQGEAARIAVGAVRRWLDEHGPHAPSVVFNVFGQADEALYRSLLGF